MQSDNFLSIWRKNFRFKNKEELPYILHRPEKS